jgi:hypothetical protein
MGRRTLYAPMLACLLAGCATAEYVIDGDAMTVSWCRDGFLRFFPPTHELTFPARSGRFDAEDVKYVQKSFGHHTPRASRGYVELDLPRRTLLVKLSFPADRKRGWKQSLDLIELDEWFRAPDTFRDFAENGRYRLVPRRERPPGRVADRPGGD